MSEKIDQFCENLRVQLNNVESQLTKVAENVKAAPQQAADAVRATIDAAKLQHEQNMQKLADARAKLDERSQAKKEEVAGQIEQWKTNREIDKLERRADDAEFYAVAVIEFAAAAVAEADLATLEAIEARMQAEDAKSAS